MVKLLYFALISSISVVVQANSQKTQLPVVDLGYEIYQATEPSNKSTSYHSFPNIRYAAPPVGDLRWKAPVPPKSNRSAIQSNPRSIACAQGSSTWQTLTSPHINNYLETGSVANISYANMSSFVTDGEEDCLFLDVSTPRTIFDNANKNGTLAPVLVWFHGGGFTAGSKTYFGSARGLVNRSQKDGSDGVVYVALNYRLGALGFLSGSSFEEQDGIPNAGLYDQQLAMKWIQDNIHRFGGDKRRVTVFGESAGGGSIMHHMTAYGGSVPALFNQAIPQSPAYFPYRSEKDQEKAFHLFLNKSNISTLAEARTVPADVLIAANADTIGEAQPYAAPIYGPTPDGRLVRDDPKAHLSRGEFDKSVKTITTHNSDEGLVLVPAIHTEDQYVAFLKSILTRADSSIIHHIANTLYPPIFNGSMGYTDNYKRAAKTAGDIIIDCNAASLGIADAEKRASYGYYFDIYPGIHAQDTGYTFYNPDEKASSYSLVDTGATNQTVAFAIQDYILSFAKTGVPESALDGLSSVPDFGTEARTLGIKSTGIDSIKDPAVSERCKWWALCLYN